MRTRGAQGCLTTLAAVSPAQRNQRKRGRNWTSSLGPRLAEGWGRRRALDASLPLPGTGISLLPPMSGTQGLLPFPAWKAPSQPHPHPHPELGAWRMGAGAPKGSAPTPQTCWQKLRSSHPGPGACPQPGASSDTCPGEGKKAPQPTGTRPSPTTAHCGQVQGLLWTDTPRASEWTPLSGNLNSGTRCSRRAGVGGVAP